jgi:TetR/AcrR family transcriptional regulator
MSSSPQRMPAEDRRRQVVEVAMNLFSKKGFGGTTTKEIAAAAGISEAIIFRHFATKRDLYTAIIEYNLHSASSQQVLGDIQACMDRNDDEGLFRTIANSIILSNRKDSRFERLMLHASMEGHELASIYKREFGLPIFAKICEYLDERQRAGALRKMNSGAMVVAMAGMAQNFAFNSDPATTQLSDEDAVETFTSILMGGILPPKGKGK